MKFKHILLIGISIIIIHLFYTLRNLNTNNYQFRTDSVYYEGNNTIKYNDFLIYSKKYNTILNKHFNKNTLYNLKYIVLIDKKEFDNGSVGYTLHDNKNRFIFIAIRSHYNEYTLLHEAVHVLYLNHIDEFKEYKKEWLSVNEFVSDYAETNLIEDIAETGAYYLNNDTLSNNPKFKLFKNYLTKINKYGTQN